MKVRCRFGWHDWPQWGSQKIVNIIGRGPMAVQERTCPDCHLAEAKAVGVVM